MNGELAAFGFGERMAAGHTVILANEQAATALKMGGAGDGQFVGESAGEFFDVGTTEGGDGNLLIGAVNGHRLQRRFLGQGIGQGPGQATFLTVLRGGGCSHNQDQNLPHDRYRGDGKPARQPQTNFPINSHEISLIPLSKRSSDT